MDDITLKDVGFDFHVYEKPYWGLETVMRLQAVKRWHMVNTHRQQSLAEHTANVALLAMLIARTAPGMYWGSSDSVAVAGLLHDLGEVFVGDIPSHTKRNLDITHEVHDAELKALPSEFIREFDVRTRTLVKFCDLADGIRFVRIYGVDTTGGYSRRHLEKQLDVLYEHLKQGGCPPEVAEHLRANVRFYAYEMS